MNSGRTFSRHEADDVFKVALELEKQSLVSGTDLTAAQLESIGAEVGISPERVREAISAIDSTSTSTGRVLGAQRVICIEREFAAPVGSDRDDELVDWLRRQIGVHGVVDWEGNTLIWTGQRQYSMVRMTLIRSRERMRLRVVQNHGAFLTAMFSGLLGLAAVAIGVVGLATPLGEVEFLDFTPLFIAKLVGVAALAASVAWLLAGTIVRSRVRRDTASLTKLLGELSSILR